MQVHNQLCDYKITMKKSGSYLINRQFFTLFCHTWPVRLMVRTPPFHGVDGGSIPSRATKFIDMNSNIKQLEDALADVECRLQFLYKSYDSVTNKINTAESLKQSLTNLIHNEQFNQGILT